MKLNSDHELFMNYILLIGFTAVCCYRSETTIGEKLTEELTVNGNIKEELRTVRCRKLLCKQ